MRKINELIWHCTATPEGREVSAKEIDGWHKQRGWSGIGYHKVVHLDGSVSNGRPESQVGAHVAGRNTGTIGYVYVGGVKKDGKTPKDTRTPAQKATMRRLTLEAIGKYRLKKVSGHRDYAAKACPCFDAGTEYRSLLPGLVKIAKPVKASLLPATFEHDVGMPESDPAQDMRRDDIVGGATAATGGVGAAATLAEITEKIEPLAYYSEAIMYVFLAMTLVGVGLFAWSRVRNR
jgi:hypothetical protein